MILKDCVWCEVRPLEMGQRGKSTGAMVSLCEDDPTRGRTDDNSSAVVETSMVV